MSHAIVVHYHEIGLKGRNRSLFERRLVDNLRDALPIPARVAPLYGRVVVTLEEPPTPEVLDACRVFGVAYVAPALRVAASMQTIIDAALTQLPPAPFGSFGVITRRATKSFEHTSLDVNIAVGRAIQDATDAPVNLNAPDVPVHVDVVGTIAFVYTRKIRGPGGLPAGISGHVMSLLSGGIDSPVATWKVLKRGARASLVHFTSYPFTDRASVRKAQTIGRMVAGWQGDTTLHVVPFGETQQQIVGAVPPGLRVLEYRRFMVRIAAAIDSTVKALVTGESLGQVASQTLENMAVTEDASPLPLLRPLVGDDKEEIIQMAKAIGTFETSILPYDDCCSMFLRGSPATKARIADVRRAESGLDVRALVQTCLAGVETETISRKDQS